MIKKSITIFFCCLIICMLCSCGDKQEQSITEKNSGISQGQDIQFKDTPTEIKVNPHNKVSFIGVIQATNEESDADYCLLLNAPKKITLVDPDFDENYSEEFQCQKIYFYDDEIEMDTFNFDSLVEKTVTVTGYLNNYRGCGTLFFDEPEITIGNSKVEKKQNTSSGQSSNEIDGEWYYKKFYKDFETGNFLYIVKNDDNKLVFRVNHKLRAILDENDFDVVNDDSGKFYRYVFESDNVLISFCYYPKEDKVIVLDLSPKLNHSGYYQYWQDRP